MSDIQHEVRVLKGAAARAAAAQGENVDLEELTGNPGQEAKEAEVGGIASDLLRSLVQRIEALEAERKTLAEDVKDIFTEAKSSGFDVKALRALIKIRAKDPDEVEEQESLLTLYRRALGY